MKNTYLKFNSLTLYFLLISLLSGYIKYSLYSLFIVLFHELGHIFIIKLLGYKISMIEIFPFGGICKINKKLNDSIIKDILIALFGIPKIEQASDTLQSKIDAATSGATITLDKDYTEDIVIKDNKTITIDLGEYDIKCHTSNTIKVEIGSTLVVKGTTGEIINDNGNVALFNNGTTTINGGIIRKGDEKLYNIVNHGTMTINGGTIIIKSVDDAINAAADGKSVITVNDGMVVAYLTEEAEEGDGIDSNGTIVINGGIVYSFACPGADSGLDADGGTTINGGEVISVGSMNDTVRFGSNINSARASSSFR